MDKFYLSIFFYIFFLQSCKNQTKNNISLFDGHHYRLTSLESEINKNNEAINNCQNLKILFNKPDLVLYKNIFHKNYNTYLLLNLDNSSISMNNNYQIKKYRNKKVICYDHILDSNSDITCITVFKDTSDIKKFSKDSLQFNRFIIQPINNEK